MTSLLCWLLGHELLRQKGRDGGAVLVATCHRCGHEAVAPLTDESIKPPRLTQPGDRARLQLVNPRVVPFRRRSAR